MNRQSHDQQIQSDNDEGFIPNSNKEINLEEQLIKIVHSSLYNGRNNEPQQCYKRFKKFDFIEHSFQQSKASIEQNNSKINQNNSQFASSQNLQQTIIQKNKFKQKVSTPYDKYIASGDYILVYNRSKDFRFSNQQINFANNEVKLDCLRSLDEVKFKPIKPFQIIQQKTQEVITQNLDRNGSIRQALLQFDSKFQCGNLLCAFKHKKQSHTYSLFIQNDTNTYGYNQWFYFSIKNAQTKTKYKFNIVNFRKRHSFFKQGNSPVLFSLVDSKKQGMSGYSKRGQKINYGKSSIVKSYDSKEKFFQLSFQMEFANDDDLYYLSMGLPYSYSKLLHNINTYSEIAGVNNIRFQLQSINTSIAGNKIPYLTITKMKNQNSKSQNEINYKSYQSEALQNNQVDESSLEERKKSSLNQLDLADNGKKVLFFIARQHPGETWSSYLMDSFLFELVSQKNNETKYLLQNFIIKCVPMINVDGIINGNFRCDLTGMDLNRNWKNPSMLLHPQIFSIKNEILSLTNRGYKIQAFFDFHGHSKQYNVFCYSCNTNNYQSRLLPYIFYQLNQEFYFPFCTFGISKYKKSTARAVIFDIINNTNVLTVQSSFFGSNVNGKQKIFEPESFQKMALTLISGCKSYFSHDGHYKACKQIVRLRMSQFLQYKNQRQHNVLSGSDSQPQEDEIQLNQKFQNIIPKNLIQECIEIQSSKKLSKRPKKNIKRQTFQVIQQKTSYKIKKNSFNSQNKNRTIDIVKQQSPTKQTKFNWETIKAKKYPSNFDHTRNNSFKKQAVIMSHQAIQQNDLTFDKNNLIRNLIDKEDHKLPFFTRQKPQLIPMKLKNQSFQIFRDAYNATQKHIKHFNETSFDDRNQRKNVSKKLGIFKQKPDRDEQFPLLCVLSQNKRKTHVQKFKQIKQGRRSQKQKDSNDTEKVKTAIQTRTQAIKQLRQKNKNSMELVSRIWRQNFNRYGMAYSTFKISK